MMGLAAIRQASREQAEVAAEEDQQPFVPEQEDLKLWRNGQVKVSIPSLGDHVPEGWKRLDEDEWFFVDSSGFGQEGESALTMDQFLRKAADYAEEHPGCGFAVVETGQFQLYVAPFRPTYSDN